MVKIPEILGERPTKLTYFTGKNINNIYDLNDYDGEKRTSVDEEYYWIFRVCAFQNEQKFNSIVQSLRRHY